MTVEVLPLSRLMAVTLAPLFTLTLPAFTFNVLTVTPLPRTNVFAAVVAVTSS